MKRPVITILLIIFVLVLAAGGALAFNDWQLPLNVNIPTYNPPVHTPKKLTSLFFAGDIMLSRNVGTKIVEANDVNLPYMNVKDVIESADISFANLESPFNDQGPRVTEGLVFKAEPKTVTGLVNAGFDILSTANNHAYDQGKYGIEYTVNWLKQNGIDPLGTGTSCHDGRIEEANGIKFGYLGYSYTAHNDGGKVPDPIVCDWTNTEQVVKDIQTLKPQVDFLIVSAHMGTEYHRTPNDSDVAGAHAAIDAGADLFIGHHPHWIQTTEQYKGKYIFYSLGNFVFDQMWSQDTKEGLAVSVLLDEKNISRIKLMPVVIENFCCPRWATDDETKTILNKINLTEPVLFDKN